MRKRKKRMEWIWEFTKIVITVITIVWVASTIFSAVMVLYAIISTGQFSFLDTFIIENSTTFRNIVGVNLIKSCVENVFKYNNFGGSPILTNNDDEDVVG